MSTETVKQRSDSEPSEVVAELVSRGREAMDEVADYTQEEVDDMVRAVGWAIYQEDHCQRISEVAVEETGFGNVEDKNHKKRRKIVGVLDDTLGEPSVGVVDTDEERGLVDIAKPVGVVGAMVPATHPGATPTALAMMALKGRNAVVFSPSPLGEAVCELVVEFVRDELAAVGAPRDLVQMIPRPASKPKTYSLMEQADMLQVTGSADNVEKAQESGTPNYCVGEGNAVAIVDETADLENAATRIRKSKTVDYATSCSADNSAAVVDEVYDEMVAALEAEGGYLCDSDEREKLRETMFPDGYGSLAFYATPAEEIAEKADLASPEARDAEFLIVEGHGIGEEYPMSSEKLNPVLNLYRADDFEDALDITSEVLAFEGTGHSCGLHTSDDDHVERTGHEIDVARVIVNQPHALANGGWHKNGLPNTLSEGGGTWGGNQFAGNLNYEYFIQTTTVARPIDQEMPSEEELFGSYRETYGR